MAKRHECRYWQPTAGGHRGWRWCNYCGKRQIRINGQWQNEMSARHFADKWLPAISGTNPKRMMTIDVAFPFEWNSYESWDVVFRVRFDFTDVLGQRQQGLGTRVDVMNGWRSDWHETFNQIDAEALAYYEKVTSRKYEIGDNTYEEMRRFIQS